MKYKLNNKIFDNANQLCNYINKLQTDNPNNIIEIVHIERMEYSWVVFYKEIYQ